MKSLIKINILFFAAYTLLQFFEKLDDFFVLHLLHSLIGFVVILILFGINSTVLIKLFYKKDFDIAEFLSISSVISLLLPPLLLTIEFSEFKMLFKELPMINSFLVFLIMTLIYYFKKDNIKNKIGFKIGKINKATVSLFLFSPFCWVLILYISITIIIFSAYYALPDLDPFYWIQRYSNELATESITNLTSDRSLFSSLIYILNQGSDIVTYAVFKYILPFLSLLIIIPAWLVARKYSQKIIQISVLLLPLASSSTILYLQTPMPQAIAITLIYYFFFFLIYSWLFEKPIFYYFAGITVLLGSFYHEVAAIILAIWFFVTLVFNRKIIFGYVLKNKITALLITLIIISNTSFIKNQVSFIFYWLGLIFKYSLQIKFNFLFPAHYVNINGQSMGWEGFIGVSKYYLYYIGPFLIFLTYLFIYLFIKKRDLRKRFYDSRTNKEFIVLMLCFLVFFLISEILPRFFNFALLPERAWIFTGIFLPTLLFIILKSFGNQFKFAYFLATLLILVSIGGALYINNLKKFIITSAKIHSAEWINKNLPANRIFFTDLDRNLLKYYGKSEVRKVPTEFFFNNATALEEINKYLPVKLSSENDYLALINSIKKNMDELIIENPQQQKESIVALLKESIQQSTSVISLLDSEKTNKDSESNLYIYYAKPNEFNPYIDRPYYKTNNINKDKFIFDQYPDKFMRIYEDKINNITIWKIP